MREWSIAVPPRLFQSIIWVDDRDKLQHIVVKPLPFSATAFSNFTIIFFIYFYSNQMQEQSVFKLESGNQNILDKHTSKMGRFKDTHFKSNPALVVSNHSVKLQIDQTKRLPVRVWKLRCRMSASPKWANGPTPISKATKPWWYPVTLFQGDQTKRLRVSVRKPKYFGWAQNRQMNQPQFRKQPSPGGSYYLVKFKVDGTVHLLVRVLKPKWWWTDRQPDTSIS